MSVSSAKKPTPTFTLDGHGPLFRQIERAVTELILTGRYKVGDRLPPESELMGLFKTSRQTVNKAITDLAKHGLVERNRRAGTVISWQFQERFVLPLRDLSDEVPEAGHLYAFRVLQRKILRNGRAGVIWPSLPTNARVLFLECLHFADDMPVQLESRYINLDAIPWIKDESFAEITPGKWLLGNIPWSKAIHRVRAATANEDLAGKLGLPIGAACLVVDRQTFHLGKPITLVHMTHPGDRFSIHGEVDLDRSKG